MASTRIIEQDHGAYAGLALAVGGIDRRLSAFDRRRMITIAMLRRSHPTDAAPPRH